MTNNVPLTVPLDLYYNNPENLALTIEAPTVPWVPRIKGLKEGP